MNRRAKSYAKLAASAAIRIPLGAVSTALLARTLGTEGVGIWTILLASGTFLHTVGLSWVRTSSVRFGREEWLNTGSIKRTWGARLPLLLLSAVLGVAVVGLLRHSGLPLLAGMTSERQWYILGLLCGIWLSNESQGLLQIREKMDTIAIAPAAVSLLTIAYLSISAWYDPVRPEALIPGLVLIPICVWFPIWIREFAALRPGFALPEWARFRAVSRFSWPLIPALLIGSLSAWADHILIYATMDTEHLGWFQTAYRPMVLIMGMANPALTVLLPHLITQSGETRHRLGTFLDQKFPAALWIWQFATIPALVFLPTVFRFVFGPQFENAVPIVKVLAIGIPGAILPRIYSVFFTVQDRIGITVWYHAAMTITNLAISYSLIDQFGMLGCAAGTAVSYVLIQVLYVADQHRRLRVPASTIAVLLALHTALAIALSFVSELGIRLLIGCGALLLHVAIARKLSILNAAVLSQVIPKPLAGVRRVLTRVLAT